MMNITVKKTGKTWSIFHAGKLLEGGFFSKEAACKAAWEYAEGGTFSGAVKAEQSSTR